MKIYNICDYGAVSDGTLQTEKIQAAVDECFENGGGEVYIPSGDFLTASIWLRSNIRLHLGKNAHLIGSKNWEDYSKTLQTVSITVPASERTDALYIPSAALINAHKNKYGKDVKIPMNSEHIVKAGSRWNNGILRAYETENISIIGEENSYIDGQNCFDPKGEEGFRGPHAINFHKCTNIELDGYFVKKSANWAHALIQCKNIKVRNLKVEGGHDGLHMRNCENITIEDCKFYTGDDCVAGLGNVNVTVRNCLMNTSCSGMRFGATNAVIENCKFIGPGKFVHRCSLTEKEKEYGENSEKGRHNMLSAFTYYSDLHQEIKYTSGNIVFMNCLIKNTDRLIHYNFSGSEYWCIGQPLESIELRNVTAEGIKNPILLYGDSEKPINFKMGDCSVTFSDERISHDFMHLCNFERIILKNVEVKNFKGDIFIKKWNNSGIIITENLICDSFVGELSSFAKEPFSCEMV